MCIIQFIPSFMPPHYTDIMVLRLYRELPGDTFTKQRPAHPN
ncbi:hypothetical protein L21SP2_2467 [Salinispira pacifica]|uniref:Uncharacterized protein n=1 Tax=Salinispira pacifica TaxID=1307761 RepID=V5WJK6_9SPIO|nr:hypothetical protein L21SP2_2467 [Salinispira pacifica]